LYVPQSTFVPSSATSVWSPSQVALRGMQSPRSQANPGTHSLSLAHWVAQLTSVAQANPPQLTVFGAQKPKPSQADSEVTPAEQASFAHDVPAG
jgi:hypothetical protein